MNLIERAKKLVKEQENDTIYLVNLDSERVKKIVFNNLITKAEVRKEQPYKGKIDTNIGIIDPSQVFVANTIEDALNRIAEIIQK